MKNVLFIMILILFFGINPCVYAQEVMQERGGGESLNGPVSNPTTVPSMEEQRILEDLKQARIAGADETARALQARLDALHGVTANVITATSNGPPVLQTGVGEGSQPPAPLWGGDVLITDPSLGMVKPSMVNTPDGDLYTAVECLDDNRILIYRSTDGGATWYYLFWVGGGDDLRNPCLAYGENSSGDALYVAFEVISGTTQGVNVLHLDVNTLASYDTYVVWGISLPSSQQLHPRICSDSLFYSAYYIYVTWSDYAIDYYPVMFSRTTDYGVTYSTPANITGGSENSSWQTRPDIAFGTSGLFVAYEKPGWNGSTWITQPWVTESNNFGGSFTSNIQLSSTSLPGYHPAVAAAPDDFSIVVAFTREYSADTDAQYCYSTDGGTNWSSTYLFPWSYDDEHSVDLCCSDQNGRFYAAYYMDFNDVMYLYADCATPASWSSGTVVSDTGTASSTYPRPSVCVNPSLPMEDEGCVAWTDFRNSTYGAYFDRIPDLPLDVSSSTVSASLGGTVIFYLDAGSVNGGRKYFLLGSITGTSPGTPLPGGYETLPLNWDIFTDLVLAYMNTSLFSNFTNLLSSSGTSTAVLNAPPLDPSYVGLMMHYAFCLKNYYDYVSNAVVVTVVP